jgi:transcriptional regulator with XRE-family HTH domain
VTAISPHRSDLDLFRHGTNAAAVFLATLAGVGGGWLANDAGTGVSPRTDLRVFAGRTQLDSVEVPDRVEPFTQPTRVELLISLSGLSQRQLASVLGVSHTLVGQWVRSEPDRPELSQILEAAQKAGRYHADLKNWLVQPVSGTRITPLDLLRAKNWRAFEGAIRAKPAASPSAPASDLLASRMAEVSWAMAEPSVASVDE